MKKIALIFLAIACCFVLDAHAGAYVAFSLKQAQTQIIRGDEGLNSRTSTLAGITRPVALILDRDKDDLILVGEKDERFPALTLDDWAVAVRSEFSFGRDPVVSIDQTPESSKTGKQIVRFEGALKDTQFGADLLAADIVLKKLGLGTVSAEMFGVSSFLKLSALVYKKNPKELSDFTRFWFLPKRDESYVFARNGVVIVEEYKIDVRNQRYISGKDASAIDAAAREFSQGVQACFGDLKKRFPSLARMEQLYYITALAQGMGFLGVDKRDHSIDYWVREYKVRNVETRSDYPLEENSVDVSLDDGKVAKVLLSGGIDLDALVVNLEDGLPDAIKQYVLTSRPSKTALSWDVPLVSLSWNYDISPEEIKQAKSRLQSSAARGMSIQRQAGVSASNLTAAFRQTSVNIPRADFSFAQRTSMSPSFQADRLRQVSPNVGGVLLEGAAQVNTGNRDSDSVLAEGNFSLILGDRDSRIQPQVFRRFITSLWSVYFGNTDPGISIDPIAPGADKQLVRYIGRIQNTDLARVMREADYLMKKWAVGTERPDVAGFNTPEEYAAKRSKYYLNQMSRFWFVPKDMKFRSTGNALIFQDGLMTVQTEFLRNNARGLQADPSNEDFARWFTKYYPAVAKRYPVYEELFEYSKLVSLANYLKESDIPLLWYLLAHRDLVLTEESPGSVDTLKVDSKTLENVRIEGGVQLTTQPQYILDRETRSAINKAFADQSRISGAPRDTRSRQILTDTVSVETGRNMMTFAPQHSVSSGVDYMGVRYQTDLSINEEGFMLTDRTMESLTPQIHRYFLWETLRPYVSKLMKSNADEKARVDFEQRYEAAWRDAEAKTNGIASKLAQILNKKYTTEQAFNNDLEFLLEGGEFASLREMIKSQAHFKTQFDLVRYYSPSARGQESEFGQGWRLLVPYQLEFSAAKTRLGNLMLPERITLVNLLHDKREVFTFRKDHPSGVIGYFPPEGGNSLSRGIALMTDGTLRLEDKLGANFSFDADGRMTEMMLSDSHRMSFKYAPLTTFDKKPYQLDLLPSGGTASIADGALVIPRRLQVTDGFGRSTVFEYDEASDSVVWTPAEKSLNGALTSIMLMNDGSFQLADRFGNRTAFDQQGGFKAVIPAKTAHHVGDISLGDQRVAFRYMINPEGRLCVDEAWVYLDAASNSPTYVVDYRYDNGLWLADRQVQRADGQPISWQ